MYGGVVLDCTGCDPEHFFDGFLQFSAGETELGNFDQCLSVKEQYQSHQLVGKYCLAVVSLQKQFAQIFTSNKDQVLLENQKTTFTGLCFPSLCSEGEIREILLESKYF